MGNLYFTYRRAVAVVLAAALFGLAASPAAAQQLMTEGAVKKAVEQAYGVEVIGIEAGGKDGWQYFIVRVMNPAGDYNEAFMVSELVIDRQTGKLISQFRHGESGAALDGPGRRDVRSDTGQVLRRESAR